MSARRAASAAIANVAAALIALAAPAAAAAPRPYVRVGWTAGPLRMTDFNSATQDGAPFHAVAGLTSSFADVGMATGPTASAGLWLTPSVRLGATYSLQQAAREHDMHVPGDVFFDDHLEFDITEFGGEVAVRFERLAGLTVGATVAAGRARFARDFAGRDLAAPSELYLDTSARKSRPTYGLFVGLDQTNSRGLAGWITAGVKLRDMGRMTVTGTSSDGSTRTAAGGVTPWMDYTGFFLAAGTGFDRHP